MSLVAYPDSDSDNGQDDKHTVVSPAQNISNTKTAVKRKREVQVQAHAHAHAQDEDTSLPPLPATFHDLYSSNARTSTRDDPSLHGGRKRAVPHVEGNWPSHVYLEWLPSHPESEQLHTLIASIQEAIERANKTRQRKLPVPDITPSLRSPLGAPLPLHVSLSRTLQIKTDDREHFIETLRSSLRKAAVKPFHVQFSTLKWVANFQRNRWFLVLGVAKPAQDELNRLLRACNEAAGKCGHPALYIGGRGDGPMEDSELSGHDAKRQKSAQLEDEHIDRTDNFHISIAWNLEEPDPAWIALLKDIDVNQHIQAMETPFDAVKAKIGNVVHNIELGTRKASNRAGAGILGLG